MAEQIKKRSMTTDDETETETEARSKKHNCNYRSSPLVKYNKINIFEIITLSTIIMEDMTT